MVETPPIDPDAELAREPAPRYLRFLHAMLIGGALAAVPLVASGCGTDTTGADARTDAAPVAVDGPLPPPDLARRA